MVSLLGVRIPPAGCGRGKRNRRTGREVRCRRKSREQGG